MHNNLKYILNVLTLTLNCEYGALRSRGVNPALNINVNPITGLNPGRGGQIRTYSPPAHPRVCGPCSHVRYSPGVVLMLGQRRRRWPSIKTTPGQRLVISGTAWIPPGHLRGVLCDCVWYRGWTVTMVIRSSSVFTTVSTREHPFTTRAILTLCALWAH